MKLTTDIIRTWFDELNAKYFEGKLPMPQIAVGHSRTRLGSMSYHKYSSWLSKTRKVYCIRLSNYYEQNADEFRNTLMHEMIHYYICINNIHDDAPHGTIFRQIMAKLNAQGWHITVRAKGLKAVADQETRQGRMCVVLCMRHRNGSTLVSVVNPSYVKQFEKQLNRIPEIVEWSWHVSRSSYFNQWAKVRTLRARKVNADEYNTIQSHLICPLQLDSDKSKVY